MMMEQPTTWTTFPASSPDTTQSTMQNGVRDNVKGNQGVSSGLLIGPMSGATWRLVDKMWRIQWLRITIYREIRIVNHLQDYHLGFKNNENLQYLNIEINWKSTWQEDCRCQCNVIVAIFAKNTFIKTICVNLPHKVWLLMNLRIKCFKGQMKAFQLRKQL